MADRVNMVNLRHCTKFCESVKLLQRYSRWWPSAILVS